MPAWKRTTAITATARRPSMSGRNRPREVDRAVSSTAGSRRALESAAGCTVIDLSRHPRQLAGQLRPPEVGVVTAGGEATRRLLLQLTHELARGKEEPITDPAVDPNRDRVQHRQAEHAVAVPVVDAVEG